MELGNIHILLTAVPKLTLLCAFLILRAVLQEFLMDNVYAVFGDQVFRQSVGILMGTNCVPLLANLFLYSFKEEFIEKLLYEKKNKISRCDSTFRYTSHDFYLLIRNVRFINVDSIHVYPNELEIKHTTVSRTCFRF